MQKQIERIENEIDAQRKRSEVRVLSKGKSRTVRSASQKTLTQKSGPRYPPQSKA